MRSYIHLLKKFSAFYGTESIITAFQTARVYRRRHHHHALRDLGLVARSDIKITIQKYL
jgi:hypothetical protein